LLEPAFPPDPFPASVGAPPEPELAPPAPDEAPPDPPALELDEPAAPDDVPEPVEALLVPVPLAVPVVPLLVDDVDPDEPAPLVPLPELSSEPQAQVTETTRASAEWRANVAEHMVRMTRTSMAWPPVDDAV
jgi:hypothetical protein